MSDGSNAGWHPDPTGRHEHRWWDGAGWTDNVSDGGTPGNDPLAAPPQATTAYPVAGAQAAPPAAAPAQYPAAGPAFGAPTAGKGPNLKLLGLIAGIVVVVIVVLVVVMGGDDGSDQRAGLMDDCVDSGSSRSYCDCLLDEFEDNGGSLDEFEDIVPDLDAGEVDPSQYPDELIDAFLACD